MKFILASGSPRRKELFSDVVGDFEIDVSNSDETVPEDMDRHLVPCFLSRLKAVDVAKRHKNDVVIGCDTVVIKNGRILGKPHSKNEAREMMQFLSGGIHEVITGCFICFGDKSVSFSETTKVRFLTLSDEEIEEYICTDEPYDKAGGYGIQGKAKVFIEGIDGDYFNVVGLPVSRLKKELERFLKK